MSLGGVEASSHYTSVDVVFPAQANSRLGSSSCVGCWKEVCQQDLEQKPMH